MFCFLLQNPLNPINYLFKSIWQNHAGQTIGKQNLRVLTSSTLIPALHDLNQQKKTYQYGESNSYSPLMICANKFASLSS